MTSISRRQILGDEFRAYRMFPKMPNVEEFSQHLILNFRPMNVEVIYFHWILNWPSFCGSCLRFGQRERHLSRLVAA